jgi:hypothetical protein
MTTTIIDVRCVAVPVHDQDAALAFYVDVLGFEKRLDAPISDTMRWIEVAPPAAATSSRWSLGRTVPRPVSTAACALPSPTSKPNTNVSSSGECR